MGQLSGEPKFIETKEDEEFGQDYERWTDILDRSFERLFERQQRVVLEKATSRKARSLISDGSLEVENIFTLGTWDRQIDEDIRPVLNSIIKDSQIAQSTKSSEYAPPSREDVQVQLNAQMDRIKAINVETETKIGSMVLETMRLQDEDRRHAALKGDLVGLFASLLAKTPVAVSEDEARRAWTFAIS